MPATASDIAAATRSQAVDSQSDAAVKTRHPGARETVEPRTGYFDSLSDAATLNTAAFALVGTERRQFSVPVDGLLDFTGALAFAQVTPAVTLVDAEQAANAAFLVARIELDLDAETTSLTLFG